MKKSDFITPSPPGVIDMEDVIKVDPADLQILDPEDTSEEVELWRPGKMPISFLRCTTCYLRKECPYCDFSSNVCALKEIETVDVSTGEGIISLVQTMLAIQAQRVLRFVKIEEMESGFPDPSVTNELLIFVSLVEKLKKILSDDDFLVIRAKGKSAQGVLDRLFGDIGKDE
jgi:hypothetical protein